MKRFLTHIVTPSLMLCSIALAEDMILKDGTQLKDAVVSRTEIDHVIVRHAAGARRVDYNELTYSNQQKYGMLPDDVEKRVAERNKKQAAANEKREQEEEQYRKLLKDSNNLPRYMKASDIRSMFLHYGSMSDAAAEYLAAEWNRRESLRLNLEEEAKRYTDYAGIVRAAFTEETEKLRDEKAAQKRDAELVRSLRQELKLAKQREEAWKVKEEEYAEKLEEADEEYDDLWRDYQRERNANRYRYGGYPPVIIPNQGGRTINF